MTSASFSNDADDVNDKDAAADNVVTHITINSISSACILGNILRFYMH